MNKPCVSSAEFALTVQKWQWDSWVGGEWRRERGREKAHSRVIRVGLKLLGQKQGVMVSALRVQEDLPDYVLLCRMGYSYNGATSVLSSRTKYHGAEGDFKTTNPSKQFDKNAYVWKALLRAVSSYCTSELFTEWAPSSRPSSNSHSKLFLKTWIWRICWLCGCLCSNHFLLWLSIKK